MFASPLEPSIATLLTYQPRRLNTWVTVGGKPTGNTTRLAVWALLLSHECTATCSHAGGNMSCKHTPSWLICRAVRVSPSSCAGVRTCLLRRTAPRSQSSMLGAAAPDLAVESAAGRSGSGPVQAFPHRGCAQGCSQQQRPPGRCCWAVQLRPDPGPRQPLQRSCLQDAHPAGVQQAAPTDLTRGGAPGFVPCCPDRRQC